MTIREVITSLKQAGYNVSFYVRKDGGVRITKINGESFRGSTGNIRAREIVGTKLSEARERQLSKLKTPKGKGNYDKRRKTTLSEDIIRKIRRIQELARRRKRKGGTPSRRNYRYVLEHFGKEEADRLLRQSELYARGLAYDENINALIGRIRADLNKVEGNTNSIEKLIKRLEDMKGVLTEKTLGKILDTNGPLYKWEMNVINDKEFVRQMNELLDNN